MVAALTAERQTASIEAMVVVACILDWILKECIDYNERDDIRIRDLESGWLGRENWSRSSVPLVVLIEFCIPHSDGFSSGDSCLKFITIPPARRCWLAKWSLKKST